MSYDKLVIHPVENWTLAHMVIISSTDYPGLGILVWGEDHTGGGVEIHIPVTGIKKPFKTRMVCGGCDPHLKDYKDIIHKREDRKSRIEYFLRVVRETCQRNGITTLIFQRWNNLQQVVYPGIELEQDVNGVHFVDLSSEELDRVRIESAFSEIVGVEFRMKCFQSYYECRTQIRAAKHTLAELCKVQRNELEWLKLKRQITLVHDTLNQTPVSIEELEPTEDKHTSWCPGRKK